MKEIKIFPIFNQAAPGVWDDFVRICVATDETNYNHHNNANDISNLYRCLQIEWRRRHMKFAFGAYDGTDMIGYIRGDANAHGGLIRSLYVLHEYQRMKIGGRLLRAAESAIGPYAKQVELVALHGAVDFYKKQGYKKLENDSAHYIKAIKNPHKCSCIPVFKCNASIARDLGKINPEFYGPEINATHTPIFVSYNVNACPTGYVTDDAIIHTAANRHPGDITPARLTRNITEFIAHQKMIASR